MRRSLFVGIVSVATMGSAASAGCSSSNGGTGGAGGTRHTDGGSPPSSEAGTPVDDAGSSLDAGGATGDSGAPTDAPAGSCGVCPANYMCGTANGLPVCRAPSGVPLFSNEYVILMENTSLSTLTPALMNGTAPNLEALATKYATGSDYHGVAHPSLPNYIALTSGSTQGITCDGLAQADAGACNAIICNTLIGSCSAVTPAQNFADQLEAANLSWMDFGESMGSPCNLVDNGNYAVRHNPFLYYQDIQGDSARCAAHVVDYMNFDPAHPAKFNFIAPNLIDDMHNPDPTNSTNIPNGDMWIGPQVGRILSSAGYMQGGLVVVVWDEDDGSGGILNSDDPIPVFVLSPYAKAGGYVATTRVDHYGLLATLEDGMGVSRLGQAMSATPLLDYFPAQ